MKKLLLLNLFFCNMMLPTWKDLLKPVNFVPGALVLSGGCYSICYGYSEFKRIQTTKWQKFNSAASIIAGSGTVAIAVCFVFNTINK
jgi:hypothetical protein